MTENTRNTEAQDQVKEKSTKERGNILLAILGIAAILLFAGYKYGWYNSFQSNSAAETEDLSAGYVVTDYEMLDADTTLQEILTEAKEQFILVKNANDDDRFDVARSADERLLELMNLAASVSAGDYGVSVYNYVSCVDAYVVNTYNTQYDAEKYAEEASIALTNAEYDFDSLVDIRIQYLRDAGLDDTAIIARVSR